MSISPKFKTHQNSFGDTVIYDKDGRFVAMAMKEFDGSWSAVVNSPDKLNETVACFDEQHAKDMVMLLIIREA